MCELLAYNTVHNSSQAIRQTTIVSNKLVLVIVVLPPMRQLVICAGGMGGRGTLLRGPLAQPGALVTAEAATKLNMLSAAADCKATATKTPFAAATALHRDTEPTAEEATIKASTLFRPGSPVCIGRCGSPKPPTHSSDRVAAAASHAGATGRTTSKRPCACANADSGCTKGLGEGGGFLGHEKLTAVLVAYCHATQAALEDIPPVLAAHMQFYRSPCWRACPRVCLEL